MTVLLFSVNHAESNIENSKLSCVCFYIWLYGFSPEFQSGAQENKKQFFFFWASVFPPITLSVYTVNETERLLYL